MNDIEIYTLPTCPFCLKAKALLQDNYLDYIEHDISQNEEEMRKTLALKFDIEGGRATVPQVIINGKYIGGYSDLKELFNSGKMNGCLDWECPTNKCKKRF